MARHPLLSAALDVALTAAAVAAGLALFAASWWLSAAAAAVGWGLRAAHAAVSLRWLVVPLRRCYLVSARAGSTRVWGVARVWGASGG